MQKQNGVYSKIKVQKKKNVSFCVFKHWKISSIVQKGFHWNGLNVGLDLFKLDLRTK